MSGNTIRLALAIHGAHIMGPSRCPQTLLGDARWRHRLQYRVIPAIFHGK
jgi:hypothetical protein